MAKQPCKECHTRPKEGNLQRCRVCHFRHQPIGERIEEAQRRLAMVPVELRRATVPKRQWPEGERWCASCQSFIPLEDCRGSQCVPCASMKSHATMIAKTYGIDAEDYTRLFKLQGGRCAICRAKPKSKRLAVDHSHKTGVVRGLLCSRCNHDLLGAGWDSMGMLLAAWHYLNTPPTSGSWILPEEGLLAPALAPATGEEEIELDTMPKLAGKTHTIKQVPLKQTGPSLPPGVEHASCGVPGHLVIVGSARDERGFYRLYADATDKRPPF